MTAVGQRGIERAVQSQGLERSRRRRMCQAPQDSNQHRQELDPVAFDLDAEIEREPPASPSLVDGGQPIRVGLDHSVSEAGIDLDAPASGAKCGDIVMHEVEPRCAAVRESEAAAAWTRCAGFRGLGKTEIGKASTRRLLGFGIAGPNDDTVAVDLPELLWLRGGIDDVAIIVESQQR